VKIEFKTIEELHAFIRAKMTAQMEANIASMRRCGASAEAIQEMCASAERNIAEAIDEISQTFEAAQEEFNAPITIN
jgi:hypothetical protein